jgi:hypothetical protein
MASAEIIPFQACGPVKRQSTGFVRIHRTRRMPRVHRTGAVIFAEPARAVADAARQFSSLDDVRSVVAEAVQKRALLPRRLAQDGRQARPPAQARHLPAQHRAQPG